MTVLLRRSELYKLVIVEIDGDDTKESSFYCWHLALDKLHVRLKSLFCPSPIFHSHRLLCLLDMVMVLNCEGFELCKGLVYLELLDRLQVNGVVTNPT